MNKFTEVCQQLQANPRRWLVTGVAGFIGSNLLEALLNLDQTVVAIDNFSTGHRRNLEQVRDSVTARQWQRCLFHEMDIRNFEDCQRACNGVDLVLHQAALGSVPRSIADPITTNQVNVDGFLNMLLAAHKAGVKRFVYAVSSSVYGDNPALPKVEDKIGRPLSPYAVSKYVNELYAGVFAHSYGLESIGLRYFNVFGRRQDSHSAYAAVIPEWIGALLSGKPVYINGDGETSRDFCFIDNCVQANLLAATTGHPAAINQTYNVALNQRTTLNTLFSSILAGLRKRGVELNEIQPTYRDFRPGDVRHSLADISKAQELLGYQPTHRFDEGLEESIDWYVAHIHSG
ncbi:MAG: SDR family oxidoreductase [Magnetococcales bacterium]|nr:SDR family oxidoreductase [Magnetococcales bacterium]MBF0582725.1 SDR family oxidoreductase [Magnetococcales bacterium]